MPGPRVVAEGVAGVLSGLVAVAVMGVVAGVGMHLLLGGAGVGDRVRWGAAGVAMAAGAPVEAAATGDARSVAALAGRGADRPAVVPGAPGGGVPVTVTGRVAVRPLGVTLAGAGTLAGLLLLLRGRRGRTGDLVRAGGAVLGVAGGAAVCAGVGPAGPVRIGAVSVTVAPDRTAAVLGALVLAAVVAGGWLAAASGRWRRPIAATAVVLATLAALATAGGTVVAAVTGGARAAGLGLLAGANVPLGLLSWGLGVPGTATAEGRLAGGALGSGGAGGGAGGDVDGVWGSGWDGGRPWWLLPAAVLVLALCRWGGGRGWRAAARLGVVTGAACALVTAGTALSATATVSVFFLRVPALQAEAHGTVVVAALLGALTGFLSGLIPAPRVGRHGNPARGR
ncbi:hypothetical protein [Jidongwangia harbinensis]|uniref:hypothetical protein n=1 Tax=Jidongwangia harbinensis TaxID=2878561 RepID=UPI001CD95E2E|nr:hypothetical protein [Jidongwangia harbinensis]MCA2214179.1 hypothetical protein [Jidongwangia harbinensis]